MSDDAGFYERAGAAVALANKRAEKTRKDFEKYSHHPATPATVRYWIVLLMMTRYAGKLAPTARVLVAKRQKSARLTNRCSTILRSACASDP
jgi:hypothetical protein